MSGSSKLVQSASASPRPIGDAQLLTPEQERVFADERAGPMRVRTLFVLGASLLIWIQQYVLYESQIIPSRTNSTIYRSIELAFCVGLGAFVWKKRPARQLEWTTTLGMASLGLAHAWALLIVHDDCVTPFALTFEWGQMVIVLALMLSFWPTLVLLVATWLQGTAATAIRTHGHLVFSDNLVLLGIYGVLLAAVYSTDRLRRREFVARVRLDQANADLVKAEEVRGKLFVNLSHDFRTPLALIHAEAELLEQELVSDEQRGRVERVRHNAAALAELTGELLELARLEAGRAPCHPLSFDVRALAAQIAAQFQGAGATPRVRVDAEDEPTGVTADAGHVRRILVNLVGNAVRQVQESGGEVVMSVRREAASVRIDVVDDGPGIAPERREQVFERFTSFDAAGSVASGIGLPVARELAELNGGSVALVDDAPHTTFRVLLPAARGALVDVPMPLLAESARPLPDSGVVARAGGHSRPALLVVEDHPDMRRLLVELLEKRFTITSVADCAAARAELAARRPDAVLSDIMLPDGDGYELLAHVRASPQLDGVPVVFVSALGSAGERARGLGAGADDYVAKPFSSEELAARLDAACTRAERRKKALEAQRQEFLSELHDGVTASLSRAGLLLGGANKDPSRAAELAGRAHEAVRDGLDEARTLLSLLESGSAPWPVVEQELRDELLRGAEPFGLAVEVSARDDGSLPLLSAVERHALRRVAREGLTNAIKHARASRIDCTFEVSDGVVLVDLRDDGVGMREPGAGRGLAILERRVRRLGGVVTLSSAGRGTRLTARVPAAAHAPEPSRAAGLSALEARAAAQP